MNTEAIIEKAYPYVGGIIVAGIYYLWFQSVSVTPESVGMLLSAVVSVSAIAVGFLATAKSILLTIEQRRMVKQIKSSVYYNRLIEFMMVAVHWCFVLSVFSAVALLIDHKQPKSWYSAVCAVWIFVTITSALTTYRVIHLFGKLLRLSG